jgi:copper chaperone CopZ
MFTTCHGANSPCHNFHMMTHTYQISGMTCNGCTAKVRPLLSNIPGITEIKTDLEKQEAAITMERHVGMQEMQQALQGTKYTISNDAVHTMPAAEVTEAVTFKTYLPVFLLFAYITTVTLLVQFASGTFDVKTWMAHFMAGFFLVFSFFKLLDVPAFARSYSSYDIIARRYNAYGYVYPFIEAALGISFLFPAFHFWSSLITLVVMSVSIAGVIQSMLQKRNVQCACLGAVFKLPLSRITLIEDALMIVMSAAGLLMG